MDIPITIIQLFWKRNHYKKNSESNIYSKISKETFLAKRLESGISSRDLCQKISENSFAKISWKLSTKNSLKRILCQTNSSRNLYQESIGRNISTTNSLKRNLYKTFFKRNHNQKIFEEKNYQKKNLPKYI